LFKTPLRRREEPDKLFELNIKSAIPSQVICMIGFPKKKNLVYSFPNSKDLPSLPKKEDVEQLITKLECELKDMTDSRNGLDPCTYIRTILTWMFFIVIRKCFDFNLYIEDVNPDNEIFKRQLNFWEFLTVVISKVWFFKLLIELRNRSEQYFRILGNIELDLSEFQDAEMDKLLSELSGEDYGVPAYASEGEIVILRLMGSDDILCGFIDTSKQWIRDLHRKLSYGNYRLRYQYPYGREICSYPVEVALSFASPSFLDDKLGKWFGETGLEHPFFKLKKKNATETIASRC
jgi:hypothetical protein